MNHNPDVLTCLANLSNDEVFTPPALANAMLDLLPQELFENPDTTFLDPACKSGVFLREIAKRLIKGLEPQMPDLQERLNHIFHKQLFGIAITELTSLLSRRGVYCSKMANGKFSVAKMATPEGNIHFTPIKHTWSNGRCIYCGAAQSEYDRDDMLESHAYQFIHCDLPSRHCEAKTGLLRRASASRNDEQAQRHCKESPPLRHCEPQRGEAIHNHCETNHWIASSPTAPRNDEAPSPHRHCERSEAIHSTTLQEILKMKFDVIIGNPPYQMSDGGNGASAVPIYHEFILQAKKLTPRYLIMIIPARWYTGGRALDSFRDEMLNDNRIRVLHDFPNASDCFPGVEIKGGVCYFLWERDNRGDCEVVSHREDKTESSVRPLLEEGMDTFIRNDMQISILHKVRKFEEESFSSWLQAGRYFGFHTRVIWKEDDNTGLLQTADGTGNINVKKTPSSSSTVKVYIRGGICWVKEKDVPRNNADVGKYKVLIPEAGNPDSTILGKPKVSEPNSCSSNTYIVVLPQNKKLSLKEANNIISYLRTKIVRFLVAIKTSTQHMPPKAYSFVPLQDFSKPWTDEELYAKYNLTQEEIAFIESMIRPME